MKKGIFITGTDTGVGKTFLTLVLAKLLKNQGFDVGVMKPLECAGRDAEFLKKKLKLEDPLDLISPYRLKYPLAPQVAFKLEKKKFNKEKIIAAFNELTARHDIVIVEGCGGLFVPIAENYFLSDLILDLDIPAIVVARSGLGSINHSLLTIKQAKALGIKILGLVLNKTSKQKPTLAERTNPKVLKNLAGVTLLGCLPYISRTNEKNILNLRKKIKIDCLFDTDTRPLSSWEKLDKKYVWHPFTQMKDWRLDEQLVIEEAKGCYLKATDGRWYLDAVSSLWVNLHGHRKNSIDNAINGQLKKIAHSTLLGLGNLPSIELAKRLIDIAPKNLTKVFYSDDGSTAVEVALKISYQYWQNIGDTKKAKIVHLKNSYHGDTLGAVSVGGIDLFHKVYKPFLFDSISAESPSCYRCPLGKQYPDCRLACLKDLEKTLRNKNEHIAALIVEPIVQAAAGIIVWPKGALKRIEKLCKENNVLLIVDEVATGFGRTGRMFACEHEAVKPDILCVAKGISAGYLPIAATLTTENIYNAFVAPYKDKKTFFHGHTYTGNCLAAAASIANLDIFSQEKVLEKLQPKIAALKKGLAGFKKLKHVGDIRQKGFMVGIELVKNKRTRLEYDWQERIGIKVCQRVRKDGIILRPLGNVIVLMPPLAITRKELGFLLKSTFNAIKEVTEG